MTQPARPQCAGNPQGKECKRRANPFGVHCTWHMPPRISKPLPTIVIVDFTADDAREVFGPFATYEEADEWIASVFDLLAPREPHYTLDRLAKPFPA